jgi:NADPH2:quinone reductase
MKAMRVQKFGLDTPMRMDEIEDAVAGPGEVLIQNRAIGAHPVDVTIRSAQHPFHTNFTPPYHPGTEAAGDVIEVGEDVEEFQVGQRVCGRAAGGAYAELVRLGAEWALDLPDAYSYSEGAGITVQFITAWNALIVNARAAAGETVLVQGGVGGVGMASVQLAKAVGCRVIATVSSKEKADLCRSLGADEVINRREEDFAARCLELTEGRGVDIIVEMAADVNLDRDIDAIRPLGRIVVVGTDKALDPEISFASQKSLIRGAQILCMSVVNFPPHVPDFKRRFPPLLASGRFKIPIFREMPLAEANEAHEIIWSGDFMGKIVLVP